MDRYTDEMLQALDNGNEKTDSTTINSATPPTFTYDGTDTAALTDIVSGCTTCTIRGPSRGCAWCSLARRDAA